MYQKKSTTKKSSKKSKKTSKKKAAPVKEEIVKPDEREQDAFSRVSALADKIEQFNHEIFKKKQELEKVRKGNDESIQALKKEKDRLANTLYSLYNNLPRSISKDLPENEIISKKGMEFLMEKNSEYYKSQIEEEMERFKREKELLRKSFEKFLEKF